MSEHLTPILLNALADGELSAEQLVKVNEHLAGCPSCTSAVLSQTLLKSATAKAGHRFAAPAQFRERLTGLVAKETAPKSAAKTNVSDGPTRRRVGWLAIGGWAMACGLILVFSALFVVQRNVERAATLSAESASLVTEACDQHVATLAAGASPQVLSSDRHTVKPWFQGKIPFSFNLPENLPEDTKLEGANLTYLRNQPTALLLYSIGKHRVSVFVRERTAANNSGGLPAEHSGFHVTGFKTPDLEVVAVSDVDPARLDGLVSLIEQSQTSAAKPSK